MLEVETDKRGPAVAYVDPKGILLAPGSVTTGAPNCLKGTVTALASYNNLVRVAVEAGVPWTVILSPEAVRTLELHLGSPIACLIHPSAPSKSSEGSLTQEAPAPCVGGAHTRLLPPRPPGPTI